MSKKIDDELMHLGDDMFWDEFESLEQVEDRYVVVDTKVGEVVVSSARLTKEKKKIRV